MCLCVKMHTMEHNFVGSKTKSSVSFSYNLIKLCKSLNIKCEERSNIFFEI